MAEVHAVARLYLPAVGQTVISLHEEAHVMVLAGVGLLIGTPSLLISKEGTIGEAVGRLPVEAQMIGHESGVLQIKAAVGVVDGGAVERISHHLPPMLPARIDVVVVVVVTACDVVAHGGRTVVVDGAALVLGVQVLHHHVPEPGAVMEVQLQPQHDVFQVVEHEATVFLLVPLFPLSVAIVVHEEHLRVVIEIVVSVEMSPEEVAIVVEPGHPTAHLVARHVLIESLARVSTARHESPPEGTDALVALDVPRGLPVLAHGTVSVTTKLGAHLQAKLQRPGAEALLAADLEITGLAVIKHPIGILVLPATGKFPLPPLVCHYAISDMSFQVKPSAQGGDCPIFRQGQPHLRNGTGIDAQSLAATAEAGVFQLHGIFLTAHGKNAMQPTHLGKGLLHNDITGVMERGYQVYAIAYAPTMGGVHGQRTLHCRPQIAVGLLQAAKPILIGVEPKGRVVLGEGGLRFHPIAKAAV